MDISEKNFEAAIEAALLAGGPDAPKDRVTESATTGPFLSGGYRRRKPADYDKASCLDPGATLDFIYATQPQEWEKFKAQYKDEAKVRFIQRLANEIRSRGTLEVLRKGLKANGCKFRLAYFRPATSLNVETQKLYGANQFAVVRQLKYSEKNENRLDMVLFLNGLPIFTAELKNPLMSQTVQDAIKQYKATRDPKEPLFAFGRCLAHFAVDPDLVYVATRLEGAKTSFLPFNQGRYGGAGNPPALRGFSTAYLWEQVWAKDSLLDLLERFVQMVDVLDDKGQKTGERKIIFPRYHQLDAVRRLVADARQKGPGQRYLIQHSAGSGKSNSISWLAHQLSVLHDDQDRRVSDSIIVVSDRRVIDRQLQAAVQQFEQTLGVVEKIDTTSKQLKQALEEGKTIIVTTLQKFPVIADQMRGLSGQHFAIIIDEAHSSQTGESSAKMKAVLAPASLEAAEVEDAAEAEDPEDLLVAEMKARGQLPNVSSFAFTATPKAKTLELFGTRRQDGRYEPFSLYTMRQAIEEGFILDVLENYTTYQTYWNLLKTIADDPRYDRRKATLLLRSFVDLHPHTIGKKVEVMVEHFAGQVMGRIGGQAKAMIVTRSRLHAVRYKLAVDQYLKEHHLPFTALVAFSGKVKDPESGLTYSEAQMNGFPEVQTAEMFKKSEHRLLIAAYKFQTGFDQPLLHTMYVDRRLEGVNAVQTLSRLNRTYPGKEETMVLDFANTADDIQAAFAPYYDRTLLREATDPNLLYDLQTRLADFHLYTEAEVTNFALIYFNPKATQDKLHAALAPIVDRYKALEKDEQAAFRGHLTEYVRLYAFLSQIIPFSDADLERLYHFARLLARKLPVERDRLPVEIQRNIDIESYRVQKTSGGKIKLERGAAELAPVNIQAILTSIPDDMEPLSLIIRELNQRFGTGFSEEDRVFIQQLEERLASDSALEASLRVNTRDNARLTFDNVMNDEVQDMVDSNFKFYKQITDDPEFAKLLQDWLFERYVKGKRGEPG